LERDARIARCIEGQVVAKIDVESARERGGAWREMRVRQLQVWPTLACQLEHRPRLESFADRRRVHPKKRATRLAVRLAPRPIACADAAACAQRAQELGFRVRRRDRRYAPCELRQRAIAELNRSPHRASRAKSAGISAT